MATSTGVNPCALTPQSPFTEVLVIDEVAGQETRR